ncbi:MAG: aspartate kinase, partial [Bacteroidia bacterium]|nr:aspartate kinase [Bacteroidia bacterium]
MKVLKFGGTSVGSVENINKVIQILKDRSDQDRLVVVVSAVGGITDKLLDVAELAVQKNAAYNNGYENIRTIHINMVKELISSESRTEVEEAVSKHLSALKQLLDGLFLTNELSPKITDKLLSFGELLSSKIIYEALKSNGVDAVLKNSQDLIKTDTNYTNAVVNFKMTEENIRAFFNEHDHKVSLFPGFISTSEKGEITTLGRGGSDYTAAILAAALEADELQIWTDVSGMFTTNPKLVKQAKP